MRFESMGFREIYHTPYIVSYRVEKVGVDEVEMRVPECANAVLVYPYIDRQCGLNLSVVAPAVLPERRILDEYGIYTQFHCTLALRPGVYEELDWEPVENLKDVERKFASHFEMIDKGYDCGEAVEATRRVELIDHLRHNSYPDDVQVALFSDGGTLEVVWMRLEGIAKEGYLYAELLNQPYGKHVALAGDLMALGITIDDEGMFRLFTRNTMIIDAKGRKRFEAFKRESDEEYSPEEKLHD